YRLARSASFPGLLGSRRAPFRHFFERALERIERGMNFLVVRRKMKDAPHFRFRFAFGTGKRHGERALDRVRGEAKIFVTSGELTVKIDGELIGSTGRCVEIGGADRHFRSKTDEADETNPKPFHFIIAPQK